jgi:hypothetical protein
MQWKKVIAVGLAAGFFGAAAFAATPVRRVVAAVSPASRAVQIRAQYDPFSLRREMLERAAAKAKAEAAQAALIRVSGTTVRPPYRPPERSPYQPPTRGPYVQAVR